MFTFFLKISMRQYILHTFSFSESTFVNVDTNCCIWEEKAEFNCLKLFSWRCSSLKHATSSGRLSRAFCLWICCVPTDHLLVENTQLHSVGRLKFLASTFGMKLKYWILGKQHSAARHFIPLFSLQIIQYLNIWQSLLHKICVYFIVPVNK